MSKSTLFQGLLVDCLPDWSLRLEPGLLLVKGNRIVLRAPISHLSKILSEQNMTQGDVVSLSESQFLLPGLIDTHIHAPQFPNAGLALDLTLLDWLEKYTFPTEAGMKNIGKANEVYTRCVRTTLSCGTTTACYFATIHREATVALGKICVKEGQRALIGKVCMDRNSPEDYCETTAAALNSTELTAQSILSLNSELVRPVITPRFVPTCSRELMKGLGQLAKKHNLHIQTHLAENLRECDWVAALEPDCSNYTQVYEASDLLGKKTILAHCCHLNDDEVQTIKRNGSGVSHCPNSNFSLKSGVCDVRRLKDAGVKVGLGTDCSGGYSPSMLNSMRHAVMASNTLTFGKPESSHAPLSFSDALYLATRGSAKLLDMEADLGGLEEGKLADLLVVDMSAHGATQLFGHETKTDLVHKFVFLADDRNIQQVWVNGKKVKDSKDQIV